MSDKGAGAPAKVGHRRPTASRRLSWQSRAVMGLALWAGLAMGIPLYATSASWRWALVVLSGGVAGIMAILVNPPREKRERPPFLQADASGIIEELAARSVERADKATVAWLTILGAGHSAAFAFLSQSGATNLFSPASNGSLLGAVLLALAVLCYSASHAMSSTRAQAARAIRVASRIERTGRYFEYVYRDEQEVPTIARQLVPLVGMLGYLWFTLGVGAAAIGYIQVV